MSLTLKQVSDSKVTEAIMPYLKDPRLVRELAYVNGKWVNGNDDLAVINPATDDIIGHCTQLQPLQVSQAIDAAERAFPAWRALLADERAAILMRWHDLILDNKEDLAVLMVLE